MSNSTDNLEARMIEKIEAGEFKVSMGPLTQIDKGEITYTGQTSDGSTADYYILPPASSQLQDLISYKDMNSQMGEIFRATYRYGQVAHSDKMRDIKKILFYAQAELDRLETYGVVAPTPPPSQHVPQEEERYNPTPSQWQDGEVLKAAPKPDVEPEPLPFDEAQPF